MDFIIKVTVLLMCFIFSWLYQEQNYSWDSTQRIMKDANNNAVHDALLQINKSDLSEGRIVFDSIAARSTLNETLRINLGLNEDLDPLNGSPLLANVEVVEFIILDDTNSTFPFLYENSEYNMVKWLNGPAIFSVIRSDYPRLISIFGTSESIRIPTIQEYKLNR